MSKGRHKLPASLLSDGGSIETCSLTSDSERLQQIEAVRVEAMCNHHRWEANQSLRAALLRKGRPYTAQPGQEGGLLQGSRRHWRRQRKLRGLPPGHRPRFGSQCRLQYVAFNIFGSATLAVALCSVRQSKFALSTANRSGVQTRTTWRS